MFRKLVKEETDERRGTGTEELDILLGGGMKSGTLLLLVQGEDVKYHLGLHRVFLAEGVEEDRPTVHLSLDHPRVLIPELQGSAPPLTPQLVPGRKEEREKIAWRYASMSGTSHQPTVSGTCLARSKKYNLRAEHRHASRVVQLAGTALDEAKPSLLARPGGRLSISSLFSPLWEYSATEIASYLFELRRLVKLHQLVAMVSVPVYLLDTFNFGYFDYVLGLETNQVPALKYDGILETLKTAGHQRCKYGVKCRSTGITIEKIVLPPV